MLSWKYGFKSCSCEGSFLIFWSSKLAAIQVVLKTIYEVLSLGASSSLACSVNYTALVHRLERHPYKMFQEGSTPSRGITI